MSSNQNCFFIVQFIPGGAGVPPFFGKDWTPELPDYTFYDSPPREETFATSYRLKAKTISLNGDYFVEDHLASMAMCDLCERLNVKFFHIPVEIDLYRGKTPKKSYYLFFLKSYISILDRESSIYSLSNDMENANLNTSKPSERTRLFYDSIELFKVKASISENLFFCNELMLPVCSKVFKDECERLGLEGVGFKPLDESYKYSAWEDLDLY